MDENISKKVKNILLDSPTTENTNWILESTIKNPNCIVLVKNLERKNFIYHKYKESLNRKNLIYRFCRKLFNKKDPVFLTVDERLSCRRCSSPIIIDESIFL
jgi:hypothetical protein